MKLIEEKFCGIACNNFEFEKDVPGCKTSNPGYCSALQKQVDKNQKCLGESKYEKRDLRDLNTQFPHT